MKAVHVLIGLMATILISLVILIGVLIFKTKGIEPNPDKNGGTKVSDPNKTKEPEQHTTEIVEEKRRVDEERQKVEEEKRKLEEEKRKIAEENEKKKAEPVVVKANETIKKEDIPKKDAPVTPVIPKLEPSPEEVKERLKQGKTYESIVKADIVATCVSDEWGTSTRCSFAYLAEMQATRFIERNDGKEIVELRHIINCRNVKIIAKVDKLQLNFGLPGVLVLQKLEKYVPGMSTVVPIAQSIGEEILRGLGQYHLDKQLVKMHAEIDTLSGKSVRIWYDSEKGVTALQPVDCSLSKSERNFLLGAAVLADCYIFPNLKHKVNDRWNVDASQFVNLIDPMLRGFPAGKIRFERLEDETKDGQLQAKFECTGGTITVDSSDGSHAEVARFSPTGILNFSLADEFVTFADLKGKCRYNKTLKNPWFFKSEFNFEPEMKVTYSCSIK